MRKRIKKRKLKTIPQKMHISLRTWLYMFIICAGIINIIQPMTVYAGDIFGNEIEDVYVEITKNVKETNDILEKAFDFTAISPYDIMKKIGSTTDFGKIATNIHTASKTVALVVATLLLMVDFFRKTINFEWSSKWENVLVFLIKIIVVKQIVQNADVIVGYIYSMFNYVNNQLNVGSTYFLPYNEPIKYTKKIDENEWLNFISPIVALGKEITGLGKETHTYSISTKAVTMFYPEATFPSKTDLSETHFDFPSKNGSGFNPTLELWKIQIYFIIMKAIAYMIFVIAIGRVFELCIYTLLAPLPIATFASETSSDIAKSFIKNYIATVLQVAVIATMFVAYLAVRNYLQGNAEYKNIPMLSFILLITLGMGVMKSGTWAKKLCGTS